MSGTGFTGETLCFQILESEQFKDTITFKLSPAIVTCGRVKVAQGIKSCTPSVQDHGVAIDVHYTNLQS